MANEAPRLSTADLRRRLLTPSNPVPIAEPPQPPPPQRPQQPRLITPTLPSEAEVPMAEEAGDLLDPSPSEAPAVPLNRLPSNDFVRPAGRSSHFHPRPTVPPTAEPKTIRPTAYNPRPIAPGVSGADPMATRFADTNPLFDPTVEQFKIDIEQLKRENQQLQQLMEEMRQLLQEASEQEQRMQAELADRDSRIEASKAKITELETIVNTKPKTKSELEDWADELERESFQIAQERRTMEQDRNQLREDEAALEKQMREMEVGMARERALLARQEQELKRLNAEIQHELEVMQRGDGSLRERMTAFQRRHAEVVAATSHDASQGGYAGPPVAQSSSPTPPPKRNDTTGLLRKIFRGGE